MYQALSVIVVQEHVVQEDNQCFNILGVDHSHVHSFFDIGGHDGYI